MKLKIVRIVLIAFFFISGFTSADENSVVKNEEIETKDKISAIKYLQNMQQAYKTLNYELLYLNSLESQMEPKQLIHGVIEDQEVSYFRYLNGTMRESLQYAGKISYFEQGSQAYTLLSNHNRSVFANLANFDYQNGLNSYDYIILGKGRIAGKQVVAIRMNSKDEYRYSHVIWLDIASHLPLRLDTLSRDNLILDQIMVVSLLISENINPWLEQLTQQKLPQLLHIPQSSTEQTSQWEVNWLPSGFKVVRNDLHKLVMDKNDPVSYIMLNDGIVSVSIYISSQKIALSDKQKIIQRGATVLYSQQKNGMEINVVGEIPVVTAQRLVESVTKG